MNGALNMKKHLPMVVQASAGMPGSLLLVPPGTQARSVDSQESLRLDVSVTSVIWLPRRDSGWSLDAADIETLSVDGQAAFAAFADGGVVSRDHSTQMQDAHLKPIVVSLSLEGPYIRQAFEVAFTRKMMDPDPSMQRLLALLRARESYTLAAYLIENCGDARLKELSSNYGLSYSHFRRMSRLMLGEGTKRRMREWRAARAVLELATTDFGLIDVAMGNGYSSAAHFSREIRGIFGMPPSLITKNAACQTDKP